MVRGPPHPASGHVDSFASLLIRPAAFADSKFLSPFPKRLKSPHPLRRRNLFCGTFSRRRCLRTATSGQLRANCRYALTRSRPLAQPAAGFRLCRTLFAGGLHRSRSVGLTAFASGKSFSAFPKCLKSQASQVSVFEFALIREIRVKGPCGRPPFAEGHQVRAGRVIG